MTSGDPVPVGICPTASIFLPSACDQLLALAEPLVRPWLFQAHHWDGDAWMHPAARWFCGPGLEPNRQRRRMRTIQDGRTGESDINAGHPRWPSISGPVGFRCMPDLFCLSFSLLLQPVLTAAIRRHDGDIFGGTGAKSGFQRRPHPQLRQREGAKSEVQNSTHPHRRGK